MTNECLEAAVKEISAKFVLLDSIQAYLGASFDMYRVHEIRLVMKCLENMAEKYGYAIVLIDHTNKSMGVNRPIGLGSIDFQATAKIVLIAV